MRRIVAGVLVVAALVLASRAASAFCGFYVTGADAKLTNGATVVVLMRDGSHTVLSMQNHYEGPPEGFAMVVPVPVVLAKESVHTLPREVFDRVDQLTAPRLVEYWEQDPCSPPMAEPMSAVGNVFGGGIGMGAGHSADNLGVKVEASFSVGEYQIVILSAQDAAGLETWLHAGGYKIPDGAADVLRPYVAAGTKFFVAKVDPSKVKFENGAARLSPLRFDYESPSFTLPVRLGLLNSAGVQDLVVNILAPQRYELANYPNVTIPTNLDVPAEARDDFAATYAGLFDRTAADHPGAVVTEYAWSPGSCDPCPGGVMGGSALSTSDFATLGGDVTPSFQGSGGATLTPEIRMDDPVVQGPLPAEVVKRIVRQNFGRFRLCYEASLKQDAKSRGRLALGFSITRAGETSAVSTAGSDVKDAGLAACVARGLGMLSYPEAAMPTHVKLALDLSSSASPILAPAVSRWVLTRLHARYGKDSLGEDLVFRPADAIEGGRENRGADGQLEIGSRPATTNNFQARYAIRHAWTGPIACEMPRRGIWGGRPGGGAAPAIAARDVGLAARGKGVAVPAVAQLPGSAGDGGGAGAGAGGANGGDADAGLSPADRHTCNGCSLATRGTAETSAGLAAALMALAWARRRRR